MCLELHVNFFARLIFKKVVSALGEYSKIYERLPRKSTVPTHRLPFG
jgi:hypothetical protein